MSVMQSKCTEPSTKKNSKGGWRDALALHPPLVYRYVVHYTIRTGSKISQKRKGVLGFMLYGVVYASSIAIERQLMHSTYFPYKLLSAANERGKDVPSTLLKITPS